MKAEKYIFLATLTLLLLNNSVSGVPQKLKCPLEWETIALGEFPSSAVAVSKFSSEIYIARAQINGRYVAGRAEKTSGMGFFPNGSGAEAIEDQYDVLTNIHGCEISWEDDLTDYSVVISAASGDNVTYIGRASIEEQDKIFSGGISITRDSKKLTITHENVSRNVAAFQFLNSYSNGLTLKMSTFELLGEDPKADMELVAVDEIHNWSQATAKQVLVHRTRFLESTTLTSTRTWGKTYSVKVGVSFSMNFDLKPLGIPVSGKVNMSLSIGYEFNSGYEDSTTVHEEKEKEVEVTREITIPPFQSIQACTWMTTVEDFNNTYIARDKYSAPGLKASEVNRLLREDGITGGVENDDENAVYVERHGRIAAKLAVNTRFLILPINGEGEGGCNLLAENLRKLRANTKGSKILQQNLVEKIKNENHRLWSSSLVNL